jgi:hypothetical protein
MPKAKLPTEGVIQSYVLTQLKRHPNYNKSFSIISIQNEGKRSRINGSRLKAQGLTAGAPDLLFILRNQRVVWMELKRIDNSLNDNQIAFHAGLNAMGHLVATVKASHGVDALDLIWTQLDAWGVQL